MHILEVNYDGIVGPTHHYGGLAPGNLASQRHAKQTSSPRAAAREGLAKMKLVHDLGAAQAVLPPHDRPAVNVLRALGFTGDDAAVLDKARRADPTLLAACASASAMWAANAATVSPSSNTADGRVHFTPANLLHTFHRSLESTTTAAVVRKMFPDDALFAHHPPLPAHARFADEGAANHMRLAPVAGEASIELFVFGRARDDTPDHLPRGHPARQSHDACQAIARRHGLADAYTLLLRQHPDAIDAGAFHNDVVAVSHGNVLLHHERAFADGRRTAERLREAFRAIGDDEPIIIEVAEADVPLTAAVDSYLFNSQLLTQREGGMVLLAPMECHTHARVRECIDRIIANQGNPIAAVRYVDVRQSMHNGGGPACLRLRVPMTQAEYASAHAGVMFTDALHDQLVAWVRRHYRDELTFDDLADPLLLRESRTALDELTRLLGLGNLYAFQQ